MPQLLPYVYVIVAAAKFITGLQWDKVLEPILHQCDIHIFTHRCHPRINGKIPAFACDHVNQVDQGLEEEALRLFTALTLPYRLVMVECNRRISSYRLAFGDEGHRCHVNFWFVDIQTGKFPNALHIQLSWLTRQSKSPQDFTAILFRGTNRVLQRIVGLNNPKSGFTQPENLMFIVLEEGGTNAISLAVTRLYCDAALTNCVDAHHFKPATTALNMSQEEYFRMYFPRSVYATCTAYNFHKAPLFTSLGSGRPEEHLALSTVLQFTRYTRLRELVPQMLPQFEHYRNYQLMTSLNWYPNHWVQAYIFLTHLHLYENFFNLSLKIGSFREAAYVHPKVINFHTEYPDILPPGHRRLFTSSDHIVFSCVEKVFSRLDILTILNPLDLWTWVFSVSSYLLVGLLLFKFSKSPFFHLIAVLFGQGSADGSVKRFSWVVITWAFVSLLITNIFSGMIGSFLVVHPTREPIRSIQELYEKGFKVFLPAASNSSIHTYRNTLWPLFIKSEESNTTWFRTRFRHVLKLQEEMEFVVKRSTIGEQGVDLYDRIVEHGKGCRKINKKVAQLNAYDIQEAYPGVIELVVEEPLTITTRNWFIVGPYTFALHRGLGIFFSAGLLQLHRSAILATMARDEKGVINLIMKRRNKFYRLATYFSVGPEEDPYLFSFKNAQGKIVFYVWAGLMALAIVAFGAGQFWEFRTVLYQKLVRKLATSCPRKRSDTPSENQNEPAASAH